MKIRPMDAYNPSNNTVNTRAAVAVRIAVQFAAGKNRSREQHQPGDRQEHA